MSPLICFPNKLAPPATGALSAFADGESKPSVAGRSGEGSDSTASRGASCSADPGSDELVGECEKRLSESLWASEDLGCGSAMGREVEAADPPRAISLDAPECLTKINTVSATSLVRSEALEDLTSIGDQGRCSENPKAKPTHDNVDTYEGITTDEPRPQSFSDTSFKSGLVQLEDVSVQEEPICETQHLFPKTPSDKETELNKATDPESDFSKDSEMRALNAGAARQTSPARKSLVPVAVCKGLFAVT